MRTRTHLLPGILSIVVAAGGLVAARPARATDFMAGADLYRVHCFQCHGPSGAGEFPGTVSFARGGLLRTDREIVLALQRGSAGMPSYFGILTEQQLYDLVSFLRTLQ